MTTRARDIGRVRHDPADLRQSILGILRRVGAAITIADLRAALPAASQRVVDQDPPWLLTELHNLVEAGRVDRIDNGGTGPASFVVRPPKRLTGLMVKGPGDRLPEVGL